MAEMKRLGRGLDSLLSSGEQKETVAAGEEIMHLSIDSISPNPYQPREVMSEEELNSLAESISENGVLQPVIVRKKDDKYELVSGERRLRAAKQAGLSEIPAIAKDVDDTKMLTLALVENLQRSDLNPIEKAHGFKNLIDQFNITQEEAAKRVSMDRSYIANLMRLLNLPEVIQQDVSRGTISMGHARAILSLPDQSQQIALCEKIKKEGLSVRSVERIVSRKQEAPKPTPPKPPHILDLESRIRMRVGGKVDVRERSGKGQIVIHFSDLDELDRILDTLEV